MSDRLNEFFAREAADYLAELNILLRAPGTLKPDDFVRLATGIRGSVQMAEADRVVVLAEALEGAARSVARRDIDWTNDIRELTLRTVGDLQELVSALLRWGGREDDRLRAALSRWEGAGVVRAGQRPEEGDGGHGGDGRIIPISELFYDDAGPHILGEDDGSALAAAAGVAAGDGPAADAEQGQANPAIGSPSASSPSVQSPAVPRSADLLRAPAAAEIAPEIVPIEELLFSGTAAFREALSLRPRIEEAARSDSSESLDALLAELFDLVELGIGAEPPNEG